MNWKVRFINYPLHFASMETEVMETIRNVLADGNLILRQETEDFESNLAEFCGSRFAVGVSNCTDALHLAYLAAGIGPGDEVITVSHTFVATVAGIVHAGADPVLVDIGDDHNVNVDLIEPAITAKTKAIVAVSLNGRPCDLVRIRDIADRNGLVLIEDSAQALGASVDRKQAGSYGLAGCFSFYPAKLLGTFGDAGAIVTDNEDFAKKVRSLRNHGRSAEGIEQWSYNCRIDNLHAAILDLKLRRLPEWLQRRRTLSAIYHERLEDLDQLRLPPAPVDSPDRYDVFQNYEIEAQDREGLLKHLKDRGVETLLPWGGSGVHQFANLGLSDFALPRTEQLFERAILLPMYVELEEHEVEYVADVIREFYTGRSLSYSDPLHASYES